jgi:transcriptional regulator with XRE-family HTH domain
MISISMMTTQEMQFHIARQVRAKRLEFNLSQQTLSEKSGVSYGSLKKFENTGKISLESLIKLALTLGCMEDFKSLFASKEPEKVLSLDEMIKNEPRKRGRK